MMEKANEYAIESLKQILTLASAVLALTITFLKDVLGDARDQAVGIWIVPVGWVLLLFSIIISWVAIVEGADALGSSTSTTTDYIFKSDKSTGPDVPLIKKVLSWFVPSVKTRERNTNRKRAAAAQNYFVLGLSLIGLFAVINLNTTFHKNGAAPGPGAAQNTPSNASAPQNSSTGVDGNSARPFAQSPTAFKIGGVTYAVTTDGSNISLWQVDVARPRRGVPSQAKLRLIDTQPLK